MIPSEFADTVSYQERKDVVENIIFRCQQF